MKTVVTQKIGFVLAVCLIASAMGYILHRFMDEMTLSFSDEGREVSRTTAMVSPSDDHISRLAPDEIGEPIPLVPAVRIVLGPRTSQAAPSRDDSSEVSSAEELEAIREMHWLPEIEETPVSSSSRLGGGAAASRPEEPSPPEQNTSAEPESVNGALGGDALQSEIFGVCTAPAGAGESQLINGILSRNGSYLSEWNLYSGFSSSLVAVEASETPSESESPVAMGTSSSSGTEQLYTSELHLSGADAAGQYEFAVLSDLQVSLEAKSGPDRWEGLIDSRQSGAPRLHCGRAWVTLEHRHWTPLRLRTRDTGASRRQSRTLAVFWRKVNRGEAGRTYEPLCGNGGSPINSDGQLNESWSLFFRRGWSVIPSRALYAPGSMTSASCALSESSGAAQGSAHVSRVEFSSSGDSTALQCARGAKAYRVGDRVYFDFGVAECSGSTPRATSCSVVPPAGTDAQSIVDTLNRSGGAGTFWLGGSSDDTCRSVTRIAL